MVVSEGAINNIMGGMENTAGVRLHSHRHKLKQRFDIIRKLGQGTYGKVQLAINKETGQEVAIKTIKKAKIETEQDLIRIRREIQIMSSVQHPQIIHIYEVFENREKMVLVMEYAAGGELYDYLSDRKVLTEPEARRVFRQVASAVFYCHKHKICHRDLKLENILLDLDGNAKIADFGLSNVFAEKHRLDTFCGSPLYASPEIVKGIPYVGPEVDCWSLGVLLYTLVYGAMPFDGSNFRRLVKQITQGDFYEPPKPSDASELIRQMLTVVSSERATIEDICNHWWVNEGYSSSCLAEAEALASQTPVRLDLLLSLAPKHIDSEHMLIQPEEEDISQRDLPQEDAREGSPSQSSAVRSRSAGAIAPDSKMDIDLLLEKKRLERKMNEDKKRQAAEEPSAAEKKKKKDSMGAAGRKAASEEEKRRSVRKKGVTDVEMADKSEKRRSVKKRDVSGEREAPKEAPEKVERKKTLKKRDSSLTRDAKGEKEKKKTLKKKEAPKKEEPPGESLKPPVSPVPLSTSTSQQSSVGESSIMDSMSGEEVPPEDQKPLPPPPPPAPTQAAKDNLSKPRLTPSPTPSTDATIKASDSSIFSRVSKSPSKARDVETPTTPTVAPFPQPTKTDVGAKDKEKLKAKEEAEDIDTEKILQETAAKIQRVEAAMAAESQEQKEKEEVKPSPFKEAEEPKSPPSRASTAKSEAASNKSSSHSSRGTTPGRSRTGSESSTDARPSRSETSSRRQSKIFSKAAIFDNMASSSLSPPPANDRPKKVSRPGGLNMSDLAKKFEEKPSSSAPEKKPASRVITPLKVSDARKAFESKAETSQPGSPLRKASIGSGGESLPTSPTRTSRSGSVSSANSGSIPTSKSSSSAANKLEPKEAAPEERQAKTPVTTPTKPGEKEREPSPKKVLKSLSKEPPKRERTPPATKTALAEPKKEKSPIKDKENVRPSPARNAQEATDALKRDNSRIQSKDKAILSKPSPRIKDAAIPKSKAEMGVVTEPSIKSPEIASVPEEARTRQIPIRVDSSESSDSESEAERLLRLLSEKREKLEMAKAEKLRKVSEANREPVKVEMPAIKEESRTPTPARHVEKTPQPEAAPDTKFATLPRGFKNKTIERPSLVKTPSRTSSVEDSRAPSESSRKKTEMEIVLNRKPRPTHSGDSSNRSSYAEIHIASPTSKEAPRQTEYKPEVQRNVGSSERRFSGGEPQLQRARRERIIPIMIENDDEDDRSSSISESRTTSSSMSSSGRSGFGPQPSVQQPLSRSEHARSNPGQKTSPEAIRKSRRERIIPIAVEGEGLVTPSVEESRPSFQKPLGHTTSFNQGTADSFPPPHAREDRSMGGTNAKPPFSPQTSQSGGGRRPLRNNSRGRGFFVDRSESFSSAGEEEEDEDDGFQILTAESLFSTLLSRVRSLTRKMTTDDPRVERLRRISPGVLNHDATSPFSAPGTAAAAAAAAGGPQAANAGFWSSLYSRDSPSRISENFARTNSQRDDDPFGHFSSPLWNRSISRDPSDADSVFSEPSFSTLPRGWRNKRTGPESVTSEPADPAPTSTTRRQFYSRTLSRDLPISRAANDDFQGQRLSRPSMSPLNSTVQRTNSNPAASFGPLQDMDRVAVVYGTLQRPTGSAGAMNRRPHSIVEGTATPSGESHGRVGGHCEQRERSFVAPRGSPGIAAQSSASQAKQNVPQQLKQLVKELEHDNSEGRDSAKVFSARQNSCIELTKESPQTDHKQNLPLLTSKTAASINFKVKTQPIKSNSVVIPRPSQVEDKQPKEEVFNKTKRSQNEKVNLSFPQKETTHSATSKQVEPHPQRAEKDPTKPAQEAAFDNYTNESSRSSSVVINLNPKKSQQTAGVQGNTRAEGERPSNASVRVVIPRRVNATITEVERAGAKSPTRTGTISPVPTQNTSVNEKRKFLTVEPYRRGKSEDLKSTIDKANVADDLRDPTLKAAASAVRPYRKSKSRDITPAIEAASEKLTQFNSGTLKKISPFEAYRRSKSKELGITIDQLTNSNTCDLDKSFDEALHERAKSPFERAKTSIERKVERAKSPIERKMSPLVERHLTTQAMEMDMHQGNKPQASKVSLETDPPSQQREKVKELEKPKSMYKIFTSKFSRSLSNVGEEPMQMDSGSKSNIKEIEEEVDKEDKFKLKRPSRFIKPKTEKSSSRTSMTESIKEDEGDKAERRPVKRLSDALNKFLGRRTDDQLKPNKPVHSTSTGMINEKQKMLQRTRNKMISGSQETLNQISEDEPIDQSAPRRKGKLVEKRDLTLESATKDLCNHLSQIESNMTSRMDNLSNLVEDTKPDSPDMQQNITEDMSNAAKDKFMQVNGHIPTENQVQPRFPHRRQPSSERWEESSNAPTESGDSTISALEDIQETENESVMDRITRKSYYTRFNEKRKPLLRRIDSKESIDQQLAAAKARLLNEEKEALLARESMSPTRMLSLREQQPATSPPLWDGVTRRETRKYYGPRTTSLPPEEAHKYYIPCPTTPQPGDFPPCQFQPQGDEKAFIFRAPSVPISPSQGMLQEAGLPRKRSSISSEDLPMHRMCSSAYDESTSSDRPFNTPKEEIAYRRLSAGIREDIPMYRTLQYRKSLVQNGDTSTAINTLSSPYYSEPGQNESRRSVPRYNEHLSLSQRSSMNANVEQFPPGVNLQNFDQNVHELPERSHVPNDNFEGAMVAATEAGTAAGAAAAVDATNASSRASSREPSVGRIQSPEPKSIPNKAKSASSNFNTLASAREELHKKLSPLARIPSYGSDAAVRPYRRTLTSTRYGEGPSATSRAPVVYKRTHTMDLPPTDSRIRPSDFRRLLHEPRRTPSARSSGDDIITSQVIKRTSPVFSSAVPSLIRRTSLYRN